MSAILIKFDKVEKPLPMEYHHTSSLNHSGTVHGSYSLDSTLSNHNHSSGYGHSDRSNNSGRHSDLDYNYHGHGYGHGYGSGHSYNSKF